MPNAEIQVFENLDELSRGAAGRFREAALRATSEGQLFSAALSGGSTPKRLYELLAQESSTVAWSQVHLFQVDERCVPPGDAESNYTMIEQSLLTRISLPKANFHRMAAERPDRDQSACDYAQELRRILRPPDGKAPTLDLIFLGMGADGHTASLFPSSSALDERTLWVVANYSPTLQKHRMTLTYPVLDAAREVIFLVSGEEKSETLRQVLEGPHDRFPAQRVRPVHGRIKWFVDQSASRLLTHSVRSAF